MPSLRDCGSGVMHPSRPRHLLRGPLHRLDAWSGRARVAGRWRPRRIPLRLMGGIFLRHGDDFIAMREAPYEAERVLQELLAEHPEVLAGGSASASWLLIRREAGISGDPEGGARGRWTTCLSMPKAF